MLRIVFAFRKVSTKADQAHLLIHPDRVDLIRQLGKQLPFKTITDLLTRRPQSVGVFTDFGGDDKTCGYETYAAYVLDWQWQEPVLAGLKKLRHDRRIPDRTLNYKNRKDKKKERLIRPWLVQFRRWPGILIVWSIEKQALQRVREETKDWTGELNAFVDKQGWKLTRAMGERLVNAVGPLGLIAHLLEPEMKLMWVSDRDAIFDGDKKRHVGTIYQSLLEGLLSYRLALFGYVTCPPNPNEKTPDWELLLSFPDLVAGTFAASLTQADRVGFRFKQVDSQTTEVIGRSPALC